MTTTRHVLHALLALMIVAFVTQKAPAATIAYGTGSPTSKAAAQIFATGTVTNAMGDGGMLVSLYASPSGGGGGLDGFAAGVLAPGSTTWTLTILNLTAGTKYDVQAVYTYANGGNKYAAFTGLVAVTP